MLMPPINGATASPVGLLISPETPGDPFWAWDTQITGDYMPNRNITSGSSSRIAGPTSPYFSGTGGVTPPGGNKGTPGSDPGTGWKPDLVQSEDRLTAAFMVRL